MTIEIKVPAMGESVTEATISKWFKKEGDAVKALQIIGKTGETGLAGGDHLHFAMLLVGLAVNPVEWWDPKWIADNIEPKLEGRGSEAIAQSQQSKSPRKAAKRRRR